MTPRSLRRASLLAFLLLASCAGPPPRPLLTLAPARFSELPGWQQDDLGAALPAFLKSCAEILRRDESAAAPALPLAAPLADWRAACEAAPQVAADGATTREFFESAFTPYLAGNRGASEGLFTGYYEPLLHGSRFRGGAFQTPILARPPDLVLVDLGRFRPAWRGERIAGRVVGGALLPYESRAEIENGALDAAHLALLWVDDPVDAFFLQIQGSGRVAMTDGSTVRLGYDGQNGQPYVAIGRLLVARGELTPETASMQAIRAWIQAHPQDSAALMDENPSYVFFREMSGDGPLGAEGVVLTPGRSLAVDRDFIPMGAPLFLVLGDAGEALERLAIAQDTGGAISGPVRGDLFWGFGAEAASRAGAMRARGRYYLLLPRSVKQSSTTAHQS